MAFKSTEEQRAYHRRWYHSTGKFKKQQEYYKKKARLENDDKKVLVNVRLPLRLVGRIERLLLEAIAHKAYPFQTKTALYAYLLLQGFESMARDPNIAEQIQMLKGVELIGNWRSQRVEAKAALSQLQTELGELLAVKEKDAAVALFHNTREIFEEMTPGIWRDWLLLKMDRTYPTLAVAEPKPFSFVEKSIGERRRELRKQHANRKTHRHDNDDDED